MPRKTSGSPTGPATRGVVPAASSSSSSSAKPISEVVPGGGQRASLEAIRDRIALETDDTLWAKHKATCHCECGMGDGRLLVALAKELRAVIAEIEALPGTGGRSALDDIAASVTVLDPHRRSRTSRRADAQGS